MFVCVGVMGDEARARKALPPGSMACGGSWWWRTATRTWILRLGSSILIWTALMQLTSVWHPRLPKSSRAACFDGRGAAANGGGGSGLNASTNLSVLGGEEHALSGARSAPRVLLPRSEVPILPLLFFNFILIRSVPSFLIPFSCDGKFFHVCGLR